MGPAASVSCVAVPATRAGSVQPERQVAVDDLLAGHGLQQAQPGGATVGAGGRAMAAQPGGPAWSGELPTRAKVAIAAEAALFGCCELGCSTARIPAPAACAGSRHRGIPTGSNIRSDVGWLPVDRWRQLHYVRHPDPSLRNRVDHEAAAMSMPADPQAVLDAIKDSHEELVLADRTEPA